MQKQQIDYDIFDRGCKRGYYHIMNRNSKENIKTNIVFVIGDIQRVKLNRTNKLARVMLQLTIQLKNNKQDSFPNPMRVVTQGNSIIIIDDNQEAWLVSEPFQGPINLTSLIRSKISRVYLGEKELIAQTKKGNILINWGAKKLLEKNNLSKLNTFGSNDYDSLFQVYFINNSFSSDFYFYSPEKKIDNLNRLYFINQMENQIIGYPTGLTINCKKIIKGLSVGRYYTLCWDEYGKLYSWGCKSLGLGYGEMPDEIPQSVKITKNVISAYADIHYSLALTDQGLIYQWGIKRDINEINQEPIFKPKQLQFKYFKCKAKFVTLKGKESNYGVLSSQGRLYVWGATARSLLSPNIILPSSWKKTYIYEPVLQTDLLEYQIHDFSIQNGYLAVVAGHSSQTVGNEQYWNGLIKKAKRQLGNFKMIRVNTETEEVSRLKKKYKNSILDYHDAKTQRTKKSTQKTDYLRLTTVEAPRLTKNVSEQSLPFSLQLFKKTTPATTKTIFSPLKLHKKQVSQIPSNLIDTKQSDKIRLSEMCLVQKPGNILRRGSKITQIYSKKWQEVLQKRKIHTRTILKQPKIKQLDEESEQKDSQYSENTFTNEEIRHIIDQTLKKYLVKHYIGSFIKTCLDQVHSRQVGNICNSQIDTRYHEEEANSNWVINNIQKLKCKYFIRYTFLKIYIRKYVKNFRKRKYERSRFALTASIIKKSLLQKIKLGLDIIQIKASKLSKLNKWLLFYNRQLRKCFKQLWNNFVIYSFKLKDGGEFNFTHPNHNLSFKQLFTQKKQAMPTLHLQRYLRTKNQQYSTNNLRLRRTINNAELKRRANNKLQTQKISLTLQVLPYSLHYNYFRKPKNLDVNVGETNRNNPTWIQLQKKALEQFIQHTLWRHSREYYIKKRQYDLQMANFIASYYETFYEKRWKFIIEYNKIEKSAQKKKREAELKRLLNLVGMVKLYEDDCIPQKQIVLEEAIKRKDSPQQPEQIYSFDLETFNQNYRSYVELLHSKIRTLKQKIK